MGALRAKFLEGLAAHKPNPPPQKNGEGKRGSEVDPNFTLFAAKSSIYKWLIYLIKKTFSWKTNLQTEKVTRTKNFFFNLPLMYKFQKDWSKNKKQNLYP